MKYYYLIYFLHSFFFHRCPNNVIYSIFPWSGSCSDSCIAFSCMSFQSPLVWKTSAMSLVFSQPWYFWSTGLLFCRSKSFYCYLYSCCCFISSSVSAVCTGKTSLPHQVASKKITDNLSLLPSTLQYQYLNKVGECESCTRGRKKLIVSFKNKNGVSAS